MANVTSNALEVAAAIQAIVDGFSFELPGSDGSLGKDIAVEIAEGIVARTVVDGLDATGAPLKPNAPGYAARKAKANDVHQPGILTGQTLSLASVLGRPEITADTITLRYGLDQKPTAFGTRGKLRGNEPTDVQKAGYLTEQGRPFFGLDAEIGDAVVAMIGKHLEPYLGGK